LAFAISSFAMGRLEPPCDEMVIYRSPLSLRDLDGVHACIDVIFGGKQNILGPLLGAAVFAYLQELLITKIPYIYMLAFGMIMVAAILFMPNGIVGLVRDIGGKNKRKEAVQKDADIAG
jgi:branched-chain amino acid transport system permease protein